MKGNYSQKFQEIMKFIEKPNLEVAAEIISSLSNATIATSIEDHSVLDGPLAIGQDRDLAAFYAPFDWLNLDADIVILGITPGQEQAKSALASLQNSLAAGRPLEAAFATAKNVASFKGQMRDISARLMDYFDFHKLFGLSSASELFGTAANRAHYTSVFRYPVLQKKRGRWKNFSGHEKFQKWNILKTMVENLLIPELEQFPDAWLIPFGPVPMAVLNSLAERGFVEESRILGGLNHPSGEQWNRHNCQLDVVDHSTCARNVGCAKIQARSRNLRDKVHMLLNR